MKIHSVNLDQDTATILKTNHLILKGNWCECGDKFEFLAYPEDGECSCGVHKHHVHCACGAISQVG
jgi:hypothetical protein